MTDPKALLEEAREMADWMDRMLPTFGAPHETSTSGVVRKLRQLADALSEALRDSQRLDWLGESDHTEDIGYDGRGAKWLPTHGYGDALNPNRTAVEGQPGFIAWDEDGWPVFSSVRAAIDAARSIPIGPLSDAVAEND